MPSGHFLFWTFLGDHPKSAWPLLHISHRFWSHFPWRWWSTPLRLHHYVAILYILNDLLQVLGWFHQWNKPYFWQWENHSSLLTNQHSYCHSNCHSRASDEANQLDEHNKENRDHKKGFWLYPCCYLQHRRVRLSWGFERWTQRVRETLFDTIKKMKANNQQEPIRFPHFFSSYSF